MANREGGLHVGWDGSRRGKERTCRASGLLCSGTSAPVVMRTSGSFRSKSWCGEGVVCGGRGGCGGRTHIKLGFPFRPPNPTRAYPSRADQSRAEPSRSDPIRSYPIRSDPSDPPAHRRNLPIRPLSPRISHLPLHRACFVSKVRPERPSRPPLRPTSTFRPPLLRHGLVLGLFIVPSRSLGTLDRTNVVVLPSLPAPISPWGCRW